MKKPNNDAAFIVESDDIKAPVEDNVPVLQLAVEQHLYAKPVPLDKVVVGHVDEVAHEYVVTANTLAAYADCVYLKIKWINK